MVGVGSLKRMNPKSRDVRISAPARLALDLRHQGTHVSFRRELIPPGANKGKDTRYIDIHGGDELDEAQMANWVKQAAALPGFLGPRHSPGHVGHAVGRAFRIPWR